MFAILRMIRPEASVNLGPFILGCYAIASFGGYLSVIAPSGLGVREGLLVWLLSTRFSLADATFISVVTRVAETLGELLFCLPLVAVALMKFKLFSRPKEAES